MELFLWLLLTPRLPPEGEGALREAAATAGHVQGEPAAAPETEEGSSAGG